MSKLKGKGRSKGKKIMYKFLVFICFVFLVGCSGTIQEEMGSNGNYSDWELVPPEGVDIEYIGERRVRYTYENRRFEVYASPTNSSVRTIAITSWPLEEDEPDRNKPQPPPKQVQSKSTSSPITSFPRRSGGVFSESDIDNLLVPR